MGHRDTELTEGVIEMSPGVSLCVLCASVAIPGYHFPMLVKVNGDEKELADGTTLRQLVASFKLTPEKVAIELNRRLVRAEKYDAPLKGGDEVEIVTFVGGG
jgi:sulfur carrier protein